MNRTSATERSVPEPILDFRSDTVTKPTPAMREAMARAEVGDDVFGEDPSVRALEARVAALFDREAALLVPSGTMGNLLALALHCARGEAAILERRTHSFSHEAAGASALFGIAFDPLDIPGGILTPEAVEAAVRPDDIHEPPTRLVVVENTANLAGGRVVSLERLRTIRAVCLERGLALHLDGARIWNASAASGIPLDRWAAEADTLLCCLSKGLGCPVGSLLIGDRHEIERARRLRKMLGGGMRQAGIIAACGLHALERHLGRIVEDHVAARELADALARGLDSRYRVQTPETNILLVEARDEAAAKELIEKGHRRGVLALAIDPRTVRYVTHLDLPPGAAAEAARRISG